jgi:type IV pilus biogenesis protein CpaD/CtpE
MKKILIFLLVLQTLTACQTAEEGSVEKFATTNETVSQDLAEKAEETVEVLQRVEQAEAVSFNDDVYVYLNVTGFDRFFLKDIRSQAEKKLKTSLPEGKVHVSTDKKIEMEIKELKQKLGAQQITKKNVEKDTKKIKKDMEG